MSTDTALGYAPLVFSKNQGGQRNFSSLKIKLLKDPDALVRLEYPPELGPAVCLPPNLNPLETNISLLIIFCAVL